MKLRTDWLMCGIVFTAGLWAQNTAGCSARGEYRQFDFWLGQWDVQVSGQTIAHSRIERVLDGCIVQENWMPFKGPEGKSWNFFNTASGKWTQVWMSGGSVLQLEGSFSEGTMRLEGRSQRPDGKTVIERLVFTPVPPDRVSQVWDQSLDGGKTWTKSFDGLYVPARAPGAAQ